MAGQDRFHCLLLHMYTYHLFAGQKIVDNFLMEFSVCDIICDLKCSQGRVVRDRVENYIII